MTAFPRLPTALVALSLLGAAVLADPTQPPSPASKTVLTTTLTPAQIDAYITQLGSKQFQKRNEAKSVLEQLGPVALPQLKVALDKTTDPEVKRHVSALIPSLEQQQALTPTRITFKCKDKPLKEVLTALEKD